MPYSMAAMTSPSHSMEKLINELKRDYPDLEFVEGEQFCWSPERKQIFYSITADSRAIAGLLHEVGHARLHHHTYKNDIDLLKKESLAWQEAVRLADLYGVQLNNDHIQDCLDSYRDWLHQRSTCPTCQCRGIQKTDAEYVCFNCKGAWRVTISRFCRPYRRSV